jgi:hypothetical protein
MTTNSRVSLALALALAIILCTGRGVMIAAQALREKGLQLLQET